MSQMVRAVKPGRRMLLDDTALKRARGNPTLFGAPTCSTPSSQAPRTRSRSGPTWPRPFSRALISPSWLPTRYAVELGRPPPSGRAHPDDLGRDRDPVVPLVQARAVAAEIPGARLEALPAGHVPQLKNPDRVAALLEAFVMATESGGRS